MHFNFLRHITKGLDRQSIFDELMITYGTDVWNYAYFMTKRRDLADDIAQEVFVKVYEKLDSYRGGASVKSWLLSITRNTSLDYLKTAWMRKVQLFPSWVREDSAQSAESEWFGTQERLHIWQLVLALPRKQREVLLLFAHYHQSINEICALLNLSEGTVKSRLHRARKAINQQFAHSNAEESELP
ncbi:MAG: RNA polymerase sigma factor [Candidatus Cohnella colombiensis]|uniref:RNA polymerase sigma factor n=1 Tax=Candidatus Cohnella colombiensis TaxID=3121368 RepID=A0AA95EXR8_9BACL|nr:MAG: RNA polymerase sigma factor [Cohnella sp.]